MAQSERNAHDPDKQAQVEWSQTLRDGDDAPIHKIQSRPQRPVLRGSATSQDTIRATATPPIEIPGAQDEATAYGGHSPKRDHESFMEHYMRTRKPSITFSDEVTTEDGQRQSIDEPLSDANQSRQRGRSLAPNTDEERPARSHSENDRSHYDSITGRHLPQFSTSPPKEHPHIGEGRFPLLQTTVDAMARESQTHLPQAMSMTSESTMSPPMDEVQTPVEDMGEYISSPIPISASMPRFPSPYDARSSSGRKASQRWRDGEAAQDFFGRAGSIRKAGARDTLRKPTRRDTANSARSPNSVASSYLKGFSLGSGDDSGAPPAVDAEGQTIGEDYVLGKQIGFGGFSVIKEVTQLSAQTGKQRKLAVKIVRRHIEDKSEAENDAAQAEYEHEVELWRLLNHRHILGLEAVYKLDEATFCFIPLNVGGTLFDLVRNNRQGLPCDLACNYTYQIAIALRYLHLDARVVHRDVKLENCLLDTSVGEPGLVRLCDFGMAEWVSHDNVSDSSGRSLSPTNTLSSEELEEQRRLHKLFGPADTSTSAFAGGSLEYAAPEVLRIANHSSSPSSSPDGSHESSRSIISPSVDIWAMGVCSFSLLMGKRPFSHSFQPRVVMAILAGEWDREGLTEKCGSDPTDVVSACLEMNAHKRAGVLEIMEKKWFDQVRDLFSDEEDADGHGDEGGDSRGWRL